MILHVTLVLCQGISLGSKSDLECGYLIQNNPVNARSVVADDATPNQGGELRCEGSLLAILHTYNVYISYRYIVTFSLDNKISTAQYWQANKKRRWRGFWTQSGLCR
jgi:hypothetical protein